MLPTLALMFAMTDGLSLSQCTQASFADWEGTIVSKIYAGQLESNELLNALVWQ